MSTTKRFQRPRDVKRNKKNGRQSRLTPWRKSAPPNLFIGQPEIVNEQYPKRLPVPVNPMGNFDERPVDCHGLTILKRKPFE